jgi:hypothetical protein
MEVYKRLGIELPDHPSSFGKYLEDDVTYNKGKNDFIRLEKPEPFCLATFMIYKPYVSHIGVVLDVTSKFLNVSRLRTVSVESLESPRWSGRIEGFWRYEKG